MNMKNNTTIHICSHCNQKNRIKRLNNIEQKFKCGKCGERIYMRQIAHNKVILSVRESMIYLHQELSEIKFPTFAQKRINEIEKEMEKNNSKIESMLVHISYIKDKEEEREINKLYHSELEEIEDIAIQISNELKNKRWLQGKLEKYQHIGRFIFSSKQIGSLVISVFSFFNIDIDFMGLLESPTEAKG